MLLGRAESTVYCVVLFYINSYFALEKCYILLVFCMFITIFVYQACSFAYKIGLLLECAVIANTRIIKDNNCLSGDISNKHQVNVELIPDS